MKKFVKYLGYASALALSAVALEPAQAQGILTVTNGLTPQLGGVSDVLASISYLAGIGFGIKAALKLKEYSDSKGQQVTLSAPITMAIVAGLLIALPSLLSTSTETIFGTGAKKTSLNGGTFKNL